MPSATVARAASEQTQLGTPVWPSKNSWVAGTKPKAAAPQGAEHVLGLQAPATHSAGPG